MSCTLYFKLYFVDCSQVLSSDKLRVQNSMQLFMLCSNLLLQVLVPRPELGLALLRYKKKNKESPTPFCISGVKLQGTVDPKTVVAAFKVRKYTTSYIDHLIYLFNNNKPYIIHQESLLKFLTCNEFSLRFK